MNQREGARPLSSVLALRRQLEAELQAEKQRAARAEARLAEAEAEAARALERFEERRIVAAELRTMLDATEYRITTLEAEVRLRESELRSLAERHRADLDALRAEHGGLLEKLAEADRDRRSAACVALAEQLEAALAVAADRSRRLEETTAILDEAFTESAQLRAVVEELRLETGAERAACAAAREERDGVLGRLSETLAELGGAAEHAREIEDLLAAERLLCRESEQRGEALAQIAREREARVGVLEASLAEHGLAAEQRGRELAETERRAELLAELVREREGRLAELGAVLVGVRGEKRQLDDRARDLGAALAETAAALDDLRSVHQRLAAEHDALCASLAAADGAAHGLRAEAEERDRELARLTIDLRSAGESVAHLEGEIVALQQRNARAAEERERLAAAAARLERERADAENRAERAERAFEEASAELAARAARLAESGAAHDELLAGIERARAEVEDLRRGAEHAAGAAAERDDRIRALEAERIRSEDACAQMRGTIEMRTVEMEAMRAALEAARRESAVAAEQSARAEAERLRATERASEIARELEAARAAREEARRECVAAAAHGARAEAERQRLSERTVDLSREMEAERAARATATSEHGAIVSALAGERDELERRAAASAREIAELGELLRIAGQELEEARRSESARLADVQASLAALEAEREDLREKGAAAEEARARAEEALERQNASSERNAEDVGVLRDALARAEAIGERALDARAQLAGERDDMEREMLVWRDRAEAAQAENATLVAQLAEAAAAPSSPELTMRVADLEQTLQLARLKESALQNAVNDIQEQLLREQAHAASLWTDLETQTRFREALDSALAESRGRCAELETALDRERRAEPDIAGAERAIELETQLRDADAALADATTERAELRSTIDDLEVQCEQLRRRAPASEDRERQRGESARLQARIDELERQHREAVQRHTAAVSGYMLELNQRTETLRQRDVEISRLNEENAVLQATCDDAVGQLTDMRSERDGGRRPREAEPSRPAAVRLERAEAGAPSARDREPAPETKREELRIAESKPPAEEKKRPTMPPARKTAVRANDEPVTVIHVDDDGECQEAVRTMLASFPRLRYLTPAEAQQEPASGRRVLAVNMLCRHTDPVAALIESPKLGIDDPRAFTYFAYAGRGFVLGMVDFFPHPFETDACASRLLGRPGGLQRLLAVSEDVDLMSAIREVLGRVRCSTATAFDARQGLDLLPMIKPEVVLVDLALPRGEALRVVSRLRSDPKTASVSVAMLWTSPLTAKEVAQSALRVARDFPLTHDEVARGLERVLAEEDGGLISAETIREVG